MLIAQTIKTSLRNIRIQKMRSFLTMLGIIIGISSVILVMSVVAGAESLITNQIEGLGSNLLGILPGKSEENGPPAAVYGIVITTLKLSDVEAIKKLPHITGTAAYVTATETANWKSQKATASITGTNEDYPIIADAKVTQGHFLTKEDVKAQNNVAVLGPQIKEDLFNGENPIGQKIKIKQNNYTVIGTMEPQGTVGFQNVDNMIFIPVTTVQNKVVGIKHLGFARAKVDKEENID
jgi:putative ABC transport system permease protein